MGALHDGHLVAHQDGAQTCRCDRCFYLCEPRNNLPLMKILEHIHELLEADLKLYAKEENVDVVFYA